MKALDHDRSRLLRLRRPGSTLGVGSDHREAFAVGRPGVSVHAAGKIRELARLATARRPQPHLLRRVLAAAAGKESDRATVGRPFGPRLAGITGKRELRALGAV